MRERVLALGVVAVGIIRAGIVPGLALVVGGLALTGAACTRPNPLYHLTDDGGAGTGGTGGGAGGGGAGGGGNGGGAGFCVTGASQACAYSGPPGTNGAGRLCHAGVQYCVDRVWQDCVGEVDPVPESCNVADDDCNGSTDDGFPATTCGLGACARTVDGCTNNMMRACLPGTPAPETCGDGVDDDCNGAVDDSCPETVAAACVRVSPDGDDTTADGTAALPFATIQAAIDWSSALAAPEAICVGGGSTCAAPPVVYQTAADATITMKSGVSVFGNYESGTWTRCPFAAGTPLTTTIAPGLATGVSFPAAVTAPTTLDGVRIVRADPALGSLTAAVTVDGAVHVTLSNIVVDDVPSAAATTVGIDLENGAEATITRSAILGGAGATESIGVRSVGARPTIRDNCSAFDPTTGNCTADCDQPLGIRGRPASAAAGGSSSAVRLEDSAGALVDRNTLCGGPAAQGDALRILGFSASKSVGIAVRGNTIIAAGGTVEAHGVRIDACAGAAPWIAGNQLIQADAAAETANLSAIGAVGACNPVIDRNVKIVGGGDASDGPSAGVSCGTNGTDASLCVVTGNQLIQGSSSAHPSQSVGVACKAGACARVSSNTITGLAGGNVIGLAMAGSGALVDHNTITGGCGQSTTVGLLADDTHASIFDNVVRGADCPTGTVSPVVTGLGVRVLIAGTTREASVHSNTIVAGGAGACRGTAAAVDALALPVTAVRRGIFRNNILRGGGCAVAYDFREETVGVSPRLLENNDLDPGATLYFDNTPLLPRAVATIGEVNGLPGASTNISADPLFVAFPIDLHLGAGSPCANAGTDADAPAVDFDGKPRTSPADIGAYER